MRSSQSSVERLPAALVAFALLPGVALAAYYDITAFRTAGALGFPLDDSWIHAQFARNLATGEGFTYTGTRWVSGSTAPLWTVLLAILYAITRDVIVAASALGLCFQLVAGLYAIRLARVLEAPPLAACLAGTLTVMLPIVVWGAVSGMEVTLACALVMAGLYYVTAEADGSVSVRGYVLLGAAALARPEALAIGLLVAVFEVAHAGPFSQRMRRVATAAGLVALLFAPIVVFSALTIGRPLPTTFYAKSGPGIIRAIETRDAAMARRNFDTHGPLATRNFALTLREQFGLVGWLAPVGVFACVASPRRRRTGLLLLALLTLVPFVMGMTAPQRLKPENVRYVAQLVAPVSVLIIVGLTFLLRHRHVLTAACVAAVLVTGAQSVAAAETFAVSVRNINELHVRAGRWMHDTLPAGARVALNDVGAMTYFSGLAVLDLEGLVSPEVLPYRSSPDRALQAVLAERPDFLVIFPHWYPDLVARNDLFQEIHRFHIEQNYISAGDTLIVYRTPWTSSQQP
ncbi:hypothetical protein BH24ACI5_BH24ACI5_07970 [soil metagenome]